MSLPLPFIPFEVSRQPVITLEQSARIHEQAKRILQEIGLEVLHPGILEKLSEVGLRISGQRVFFEPALVEQHVEELRRRVSTRRVPAPALDDRRLTLYIIPYAMNVQDLDTGQVVPYTTGRLVEMCKLVDSLAGEGVTGTPPGTPVDLPADLQPVAQYRIAALYARQNPTAVDPTSARSVHYILDMAEVMGHPVHSLPVYIPTPLRLGGESLEVVLACLDRLEQITVNSMPSTGTSAPIHPFGALALNAAETLGGMIALRIFTGKPVTAFFNIFPSNLRSGAMVFGSPENMLWHLLSMDFNCFYHGGQPGTGAPANIHVMSKLPDAQAAAEKAAIMALGAALGARGFGSAGLLSLDEIFSAEQLLLDCEIRDWVQRAIQGVWLGEEAVDDWLEEVRAGVAGSFMRLDSTLDHYRTQTWYPRWFTRDAIGSWLSEGQPQLGERLRAEARRRIAAHDFELDTDRRRAIERIFQAAKAAVG